MNADGGNRTYVLGHSDEELERLERQAELFATATEAALRRAGLGPGKRVLDLGCGVGDVSLAAAQIVGPTGSVLGIDKSRDAVETANRRMAGSGLAWAQCAQGDIFDVDASGFDAVIGRFILMHLAAPRQVLTRLRQGLKPGGIVAFIEMDLSSAAITPPMPLFERCMEAIIDVYERAGMEPNMGSKLYAAFRATGLAPTLDASCRVEGGPNADVYAYLARTVKSLLPTMKGYALATEDLEAGDLSERLLEQAHKADYCVAFPRLIGAWATI